MRSRSMTVLQILSSDLFNRRTADQSKYHHQPRDTHIQACTFCKILHHFSQDKGYVDFGGHERSQLRSHTVLLLLTVGQSGLEAQFAPEAFDSKYLFFWKSTWQFCCQTRASAVRSDTFLEYPRQKRQIMMIIHTTTINPPSHDPRGFSTTVYLNLIRLGVGGGGVVSSLYCGFLRGVEGVSSGLGDSYENFFK